MNIYYQPKSFGLRLLNSAYFFNLKTMVAIWMRDDRKIFWGFRDIRPDNDPFEGVGIDRLSSSYRRERCAMEINSWVLDHAHLDDMLWDRGQELLIEAWRNA